MHQIVCQIKIQVEFSVDDMMKADRTDIGYLDSLSADAVGFHGMILKTSILDFESVPERDDCIMHENGGEYTITFPKSFIANELRFVRFPLQAVDVRFYFDGEEIPYIKTSMPLKGIEFRRPIQLQGHDAPVLRMRYRLDPNQFQAGQSPLNPEYKSTGRFGLAVLGLTHIACQVNPRTSRDRFAESLDSCLFRVIQ